MIEVGPHDNGRSVWVYRRRLGVACLCGHRALVELERAGIHSGDMEHVYSRRFRCTACGARSVQLWIMQSDQDEAAFLASK